MLQTLTERLFDDSDRTDLDPFAVFEEWFALARDAEPNDPHAMALATVDDDGMPDVRMVLLNARDARGFCFFTNFESDKGRQLHAHPKAAVVMHWKSLRRQVRMRGPVEVVTPEEADAYFASRPKGSQIASSASEQSRVLDSKLTLLNRVSTLATTVDDGPVPRPPHWSGFRLLPSSIEFWKDGEFRLHDRVRFTRDGERWTSERLYP
jgi:pyridoxamine 5'-phosphate oxidase